MPSTTLPPWIAGRTIRTHVRAWTASGLIEEYECTYVFEESQARYAFGRNGKGTLRVLLVEGLSGHEVSIIAEWADDPDSRNGIDVYRGWRAFRAQQTRSGTIRLQGLWRTVDGSFVGDEEIR